MFQEGKELDLGEKKLKGPAKMKKQCNWRVFLQVLFCFYSTN
jgi:hypothetical protein